MPELPEVETIKKVIDPQIQGLIIEKVTVRRPEVTAYPRADDFCMRLTGQTISHMMRRGKFLIIWLCSNDRIILHLRMTGCLLIAPTDSPEEKYTHIIFSLNNGNELRFSDTRRFGRFWLIKKGEADVYSGIEKLGIEPFDKALSAEYLHVYLGRRKKSVKECLLDQNIIAGIGNIYSDEILFSSGIYPSCPANRLKMSDWERLAVALPECISYFIGVNEVTPEEYLETKGQDYRNTPYLQVYGQEGKPCPKCGTILCRIVVGGRGSVHCPVCQKI